MATVEKDFDCLAQFDEAGWTANNHYHSFLLRQIPRTCDRALEIGCGTGAFSRHLARRARRVMAIDLSSEMIRVARSRSTDFANIDFEVSDVVQREFVDSQFDCIATLATLHHVPLPAVLEKLKRALKTGGALVVLDLYQPETKLMTIGGMTDQFLNVMATGTSLTLRLVHNRRLRRPRAARAAWQAHGETDRYMTMAEVRSVYGSMFPGVLIRQHLLWRYSAVWVKP